MTSLYKEIIPDKLWRIGKKTIEKHTFTLYLLRNTSNTVINSSTQQGGTPIYIALNSMLPDKYVGVYVDAEDIFEKSKKKITVDSNFLLQKARSFLTNSQVPLEAPRYDSKRGVIHFYGEHINLGARADKEKELCSILFSSDSLSKMWGVDELMEKIGETKLEAEDVKKYGKRFHSHANSINKKVAAKTKIEDLILAKTTQIQLNPKYLK